MKIFAIGDLHLPGGDDKPMDVFGAHWEGHFDRIAASWRACVTPEDLVLIPGDISWAMQLSAALPDLEAIGQLPGKKVLLRGNHDYWWSSITHLRDVLPLDMYALQNDALRFQNVTVCGTRGWTIPNAHTAPEDVKIFERELLRLEMSLERGKKLGGRLIVMTHFPPLLEDGQSTRVTDLLSAYAPTDVFYGHLHGSANRNAFCGTMNGTRYHCVSCDKLGFQLLMLSDDEKMAAQP